MLPSASRLCCFFFKAEDGIRDYKVTGVQSVLFRSRGAIDVTPVQQAADEPLVPGFDGLDARRRGMGHWLSSGRDTEPVTEPESAALAMALIIAPIGSGSPGFTRLAGRSGRFFKASYCVAAIGFSGRWRSARPCSLSGASSLAHSERNAAIASRCSRISARS